MVRENNNFLAHHGHVLRKVVHNQFGSSNGGKKRMADHTNFHTGKFINFENKNRNMYGL